MQETCKPEELHRTGYVALRDYFTLWLERLELFYNRRFEDLDAKTIAALAAADKAVGKAEIATEKRFEGVNELRGALSDQAATLMSRSEALVKFENMQKDIAALAREIQERRDAAALRSQNESRETRAWLIPVIVIGVIGAINLIINLFPVIHR